MERIIKEKLYRIVFEADTFSGKLFDVALLIAILLSVILVMLESVAPINEKFGVVLKVLEWIITIFFAIEYVLRIYIVHKPVKYVLSFYGVIDLLSVIPTFLDLIISGAGGFMVIRAVRLLRIFRILKLTRYVSVSRELLYALRASRRKISVFLYAVMMIVIVMGTVMYIVEGPKNGFTSIPESMYWTVVTLTTVGYGDITPHTTIGKMLSAVLMVLGYAIIAVPTGIVTSELAAKGKRKPTTITCHECLHEAHDPDAKFCKFCGSHLEIME